MVVQKKIFTAVLACALAALLFPAASKGIMKKVELPEMVNRAGSIVHGTVLSNECRMAEDGTIYTYTTLAVIEELTGTHPEGSIVIRNMGGEVGGKGLVVSDVPTFEPGEEVIVFIEKEPRVEETQLVGWEQGKFAVRDGIVERTLQPVEAFKDQVRTLLVSTGSN
jgi:hypothetical protein